MIRRLAFDTCNLIHQWRRKSGESRGKSFSKEEVEGWADELIQLHKTSAICTVVRLEFLCNTDGKEKLQRAREYLDRFRVVDAGELTRDDLKLAEIFAPRRVSDLKGSRQTGDCLIAAVYRRLNYSMVPTSEMDRDLVRRIQHSPGE